MLSELVTQESFRDSSYLGKVHSETIELLSRLKKDYLILIASNGSKPYIQKVIHEFKLPITETPITLNEDTILCKSDILNSYQLQYQLKPSEIIMIGDRITDLEAAQNSKTHFIGITSHYGKSIEELKACQYKIEDLSQIEAIIQQIKLNSIT